MFAPTQGPIAADLRSAGQWAAKDSKAGRKRQEMAKRVLAKMRAPQNQLTTGLLVHDFGFFRLGELVRAVFEFLGEVLNFVLRAF